MKWGEPGFNICFFKCNSYRYDAATTPGANTARAAGGGGGGERHASQMTEAEVTRHYERIEQEVLAESGGIPLARLRDPASLWNGARPGLCKLTRAGKTHADGKGKGNAFDAGGDDDASKSCFLSRNYTEGMRSPTAFLAAPPLFVLCQMCGDVAWEPVRDAMYRQNKVFCRACLCIAEGDEYGDSVPEDAEAAAAIMGLRIMCRNALVGSRTQQGALVWRIDNAGCPEVAKLGERGAIEGKCMYAMEECGLPRGANPADCCRRRVRRRELTDHLEGCDHRMVMCAYAGCARRTQARYAENHGRLCEQRPFTCPNRPRCKWSGKRMELEAHLEQCLHEVVPCGFVDSANDVDCCGVKLARVTMQAHRDVCQFQRGRCQFCGALQSLRQLGRHEAECPRRHYACRRCTKSVHVMQKRQHDANVCPAVEVDCGYRKYGCAERVQRSDYAAHMAEDFHVHMRLILVHTAADPGGAAASAPAAGGASDADVGSGGDGFEALVTRHELTRADVRTLAKTSAEMAAGFDREVAGLREEAARAEDEASDAAQRLALEIRAARAAAAAAVAAVDADVISHERSLEDRLLAMYNDSVGMRRRAERDLAAIGSMDEALAATRDKYAELGNAREEMLRELGSALLGLTAAISPALEVRTRVGAAQSAPLNACADKLATMEWHGADRAIIAWERLQDIRENFRGHVRGRRQVSDQLEEKVAALEERRFITPGEDSELRKRSKEEVINRVRAKMSAVAKIAKMSKLTQLLGSPAAAGGKAKPGLAGLFSGGGGGVIGGGGGTGGGEGGGGGGGGEGDGGEGGDNGDEDGGTCGGEGEGGDDDRGTAPATPPPPSAPPDAASPSSSPGAFSPGSAVGGGSVAGSGGDGSGAGGEAGSGGGGGGGGDGSGGAGAGAGGTQRAWAPASPGGASDEE
jgi:hypothetical protein